MPEKKIALLKTIEGLKIDPIISAELDLVAKRLQDSGWVIEEPKAPNFQEAAKFQATLWLGEFRRTGGEAITKENDPDSNFIYSQMSRRCPDTSLEKFMDSLQQRARISREWNKFFDQYPIILCPITGDIPFPDLKDLESEESFDLVFDSMLPQIAPPYMGLPGLSFATSQTKQKIPLGVQFISRKFREDLLLNVGYDLEKYYPKIEPVLPNF
jgi:amidase